jgi:hypothetical protein
VQCGKQNKGTKKHRGAYRQHAHQQPFKRYLQRDNAPSGALIHVCVVAVAIVDDDKLKIEFQSSARREGAASAWLRLLHVGRALMNK